MIERGYFTRALQIVTDDPAHYILGGLLLHLIALLSFGLLVGPAIIGIVWITLKRVRGEEVHFPDLFRGFDIFSNALVAGVVFGLMLAGGLLLGLVPGIIIGGLFCFIFPFIIDKEMPLPDAMIASRTLPGPEDLLDRSLFFLVALLIGVSGLVILLIGWVFTWSIMWAAIAVAYEDLTHGSTEVRPS